jgi:hypothetical protein
MRHWQTPWSVLPPRRWPGRSTWRLIRTSLTELFLRLEIRDPIPSSLRVVASRRTIFPFHCLRHPRPPPMGLSETIDLVSAPDQSRVLPRNPPTWRIWSSPPGSAPGSCLIRTRMRRGPRLLSMSRTAMKMRIRRPAVLLRHPLRHHREGSASSNESLILRISVDSHF